MRVFLARRPDGHGAATRAAGFRHCRNPRIRELLVRSRRAWDEFAARPARRAGDQEGRMATRLRAIAPLTISIGVLAFVASEIALNFTFHWVTVQDGVFGKYGLPEGIHLVLPALFVAWGLFFLLGANGAALGKTVTAAATGSVAAGIAMWLEAALAGAPDFWG